MTEIRDYVGCRLTSDLVDCALPVSVDSRSQCAFSCLYCFADNTVQRIKTYNRTLGSQPLGELRRILDPSVPPSKLAAIYREALHFDSRNADGYPCPIQLGALSDPGDHYERKDGWFLGFAKIITELNQPVRVSTKGDVWTETPYVAALSEKPHLWWFTFSIVSTDDELMQQVDRGAPVPSVRLSTMKTLHNIGCTVGLRLRPILPGLTDRTRRVVAPWRDLLRRARDAGAESISMEVGFVPGAAADFVRKRWESLSRLCSVDLLGAYRRFGPMQGCTRPSYPWTEQIMHSIYDEAHDLGMLVGVSDPVWKQLTDVGCCCGITPDHPVFGNWKRESLTNRLIEMRDGIRADIGPNDVLPGYLLRIRSAGIVNPGVGPTAAWDQRRSVHALYKDVWNNPEAERSPAMYLQGAVMPSYRDAADDLHYVYRGLQRAAQRNTYAWRLPGVAVGKQ